MIEKYKFCVKGYIQPKCDSCEIKHLCNDLHTVLDKMIIESSLEPIIIDTKTMEIQKYNHTKDNIRLVGVDVMAKYLNFSVEDTNVSKLYTQPIDTKPKK